MCIPGCVCVWKSSSLWTIVVHMCVYVPLSPCCCCCVCALPLLLSQCRRSDNGHMGEHCSEAGHLLVLSPDDLSAWCYGCDSYIDTFAYPELFSAYGACPRWFVLGCMLLCSWRLSLYVLLCSWRLSLCV